MENKLTKIGDELGLVLDQETMEKLNFTGNCELELTVVDDSLIVQRVDGSSCKSTEDSP